MRDVVWIVWIVRHVLITVTISICKFWLCSLGKEKGFFLFGWAVIYVSVREAFIWMSQWLCRPLTGKSLSFFDNYGLEQWNEVLHKVFNVFRSNYAKIRSIWFLLLVTTNSIFPSQSCHLSQTFMENTFLKLILFYSYCALIIVKYLHNVYKKW